MDLFTPNEQEALALTGESEATTAAERFMQMGHRQWSSPAVGMDWSGSTAKGPIPPAPSVQEVDATGCGDGFIAGCIAAGLDGLPLRDQLIRGSMVGPSSVSNRSHQASRSRGARFDVPETSGLYSELSEAGTNSPTLLAGQLPCLPTSSQSGLNHDLGRNFSDRKDCHGSVIRWGYFSGSAPAIVRQVSEREGGTRCPP